MGARGAKRGLLAHSVRDRRGNRTRQKKTRPAGRGTRVTRVPWKRSGRAGPAPVARRAMTPAGPAHAERRCARGRIGIAARRFSMRHLFPRRGHSAGTQLRKELARNARSRSDRSPGLPFAAMMRPRRPSSPSYAGALPRGAASAGCAICPGGLAWFAGDGPGTRRCRSSVLPASVPGRVTFLGALPLAEGRGGPMRRRSLRLAGR